MVREQRLTIQKRETFEKIGKEKTIEIRKLSYYTKFIQENDCIQFIHYNKTGKILNCYVKVIKIKHYTNINQCLKDCNLAKLGNPLHTKEEIEDYYTNHIYNGNLKNDTPVISIEFQKEEYLNIHKEKKLYIYAVSIIWFFTLICNYYHNNYNSKESFLAMSIILALSLFFYIYSIIFVY